MINSKKQIKTLLGCISKHLDFKHKNTKHTSKYTVKYTTFYTYNENVFQSN